MSKVNRNTKDERAAALDRAYAAVKKEVTSNDDIEALIEAELAKGDQRMDSARVLALIDLVLKRQGWMNADGELIRDGQPLDLEARRGDNWRRLEDKMNATEPVKEKPTRRGWLARSKRGLTAIACCLLLLVTSFGAAQAFGWDFLVRIFRPVMETLGLNLNVSPDEGAGDLIRKQEAPERHEQAVPEVISQRISERSQVPQSFGPFRALPSWLPRGYQFSYAEIYQDYNEGRLFSCYRDGDDELFVQIVAFSDISYVAANSFEQQIEDARIAAGAETADNPAFITDGDFCTGIYSGELAYIMVWGNLSQADISAVITSLRSEYE